MKNKMTISLDNKRNMTDSVPMATCRRFNPSPSQLLVVNDGGIFVQHLGILWVVDFAGLNFNMLIMPWFTFDSDWFRARKEKQGKTLLLYDGICGLCHKAVQFFSKEDRARILAFASLQSETAKQVRERHPNFSTELKTVFLVENWKTAGEKNYQKSEAILRALDYVGGFWRPVSWLRLVPLPIRDGIYDWVAKNRYRWIGRKNVCELPNTEWKG